MTIPFVEARWFTPTSGRKVDLLVIHAMQAAEKGTTAESVAAFFQAGSRRASAHYCHDDNSTVQCVRERDVAWAAPGANHNGIHLELAGFSEQTARQWADAFSSQMLREQAGPIAASVCTRYGLPIRYVDAAGLLAGHRGITTHNEVSQAFKRSTHWDPGPHFPMGSFVKIVAALAGPQEEDMDYTTFKEYMDRYLTASDAFGNERPGMSGLTARGQRSWKTTAVATLPAVQRSYNLLRAVAEKVGVDPTKFQ